MNTLQSTFPDRLTTLSTGSPGLRGSIHVDILTPGTAPATGAASGASPDAPILDFVSSDETLDRYSEIITASGWRLDSYRRNPVFQNAHQYGDIIFTLGKALITEVRQINGRAALYQRLEFATAANPIARIAHALYAGGFLHTVSVGFVPIRWEDNPGPSTSTPAGASAATTNPPGPRRRYLEQELLEVSAVPIPANPNAIALALKSGAIERAALAETLEILHQGHKPSSTSAAAPAPAPISPTGPIRPIPLSLIRDLHRLLTT